MENTEVTPKAPRAKKYNYHCISETCGTKHSLTEEQHQGMIVAKQKKKKLPWKCATCGEKLEFTPPAEPMKDKRKGKDRRKEVE